MAELIPVIAHLLEEAAPYVATRFGQTGPLRYKEGHEAVTAVDAAVERVIAAHIHEHFPDHSVVGEELGRSGARDSDWEWHLDPLDGTLNYALGIPFFSVAIAVLHRGTVRAGGVIDPLRGEIFTAERGAGAWSGDRRLQVSDRAPLRECIGSLQSSRKGIFVADKDLRHTLRRSVGKIRRLGSVALELAYVAAGRFDLLLLSRRNPPHLHDVAAGTLIVEEAGGRVTDHAGGPFGPDTTALVVSNGRVHDQVLDLIAQRRRTRR